MRVAFIVPGRLATISGGYGYDRAIITGMRAEDHIVDIVELPGTHPLPDATAEEAAASAWAALPPGAIPVIDGLGLPAFFPLRDALASRAAALIHHPTALETGHTDAARDALKAIETKLFPMLPRLIVTSTETAERLVQEFAVDSARITVVTPGTSDAPRSPGSGGPTCQILSVGSLIPRKGHDLLIRALAKLFDLDWRLTIVGGPVDGMHAQTLRALASELHVPHHITLAGEVVDDALETLWCQADLFALATHYEGYGMAIAEALKRGIPVAVTKGGAASALVTPEAGIACDVGDLVTYSKALRRMIFDKPLRKSAADAAWNVGKNLPDWPQQARAFAAALA